MIPKGQVLLQEGDKSNNKCYILLTGDVAVVKSDQKSKDKRRGIKHRPSIGIEDKLGLFNSSNSNIQNNHLNPTNNTTTSNHPSSKNNRKKYEVEDDEDSDTSLCGNLSQPNNLSIKRKSFFPEHSQNYQATFIDIHKLEGREISANNFFEKEIPAGLMNTVLAYGNPVFIKQSGQMFGEVALIEDTARTATLIALSDCMMMTFTKKNFSYIKSYYEQEFEQRKEFLMKLLPQIDLAHEEKKKNNFVMNFVEKKFNRVIFF